MDFYSKAAMERAMKIQEVLLRAMARKVTWFQAAEILGLVIGILGAFGNAMRSLATTGCSIGGEANRHPNAFPWPQWRRCWGCIAIGISI